MESLDSWTDIWRFCDCIIRVIPNKIVQVVISFYKLANEKPIAVQHTSEL